MIRGCGPGWRHADRPHRGRKQGDLPGLKGDPGPDVRATDRTPSAKQGLSGRDTLLMMSRPPDAVAAV